MTLDLELRQNLAEELRAECERIRTENAVFEARSRSYYSSDTTRYSYS